jgi:hypothetical protein
LDFKHFVFLVLLLSLKHDGLVHGSCHNTYARK